MPVDVDPRPVGDLLESLARAWQECPPSDPRRVFFGPHVVTVTEGPHGTSVAKRRSRQS
jgi:hypothetical protein